MRKWFLPIVLGIAIAVLGVVTVIGMLQRDTAAPEIRIPAEEIVYKEGDPAEVLLEGLEATDTVDGNVTDTLRVYSIIPLEAEGTAKVIYAAHDRSMNMTTAERSVQYQRNMSAAVAPNEESPLLQLNAYGDTLKKGEVFNPFLYISALQDDKDSAEDLQRRLTISGNYDLTKSGRYSLNFTVADSDGNTSNAAEFLLVVE